MRSGKRSQGGISHHKRQERVMSGYLSLILKYYGSPYLYYLVNLFCTYLELILR